MLRPELVRVRRRSGQLFISKLSGAERERALVLAGQILAILRGAVGNTRGEIAELLSGLDVKPKEKKLALGLQKLAEDQASFVSGAVLDAEELRRTVFLRAAEERTRLAFGEHFDAERVLADVGRELGCDAEQVRGALYSDLHSAERLQAAPVSSAEALLEQYQTAQVQALLLCAVSVVAEVRCASADAYRALFQKLKFRQLLFRLSPLDAGGYRIEIDGPYSLFEKVTKYGLELALTLPALQACQELRLSAELSWGKRREALRFEFESHAGRDAEPVALRDEVSRVIEACASEEEWSVAPAQQILELPGVGLCVPDLVFTHRASERRVLCELLGFWSREAVWKRVELVERGLSVPIVFALSSRLRVSEAVLDDATSAALYVYKGSPSARALLGKVAELAARAAR